MRFSRECSTRTALPRAVCVCMCVCVGGLQDVAAAVRLHAKCQGWLWLLAPCCVPAYPNWAASPLLFTAIHSGPEPPLVCLLHVCPSIDTHNRFIAQSFTFSIFADSFLLATSRGAFHGRTKLFHHQLSCPYALRFNTTSLQQGHRASLSEP